MAVSAQTPYTVVESNPTEKVTGPGKPLGEDGALGARSRHARHEESKPHPADHIPQTRSRDAF